MKDRSIVLIAFILVITAIVYFSFSDKMLGSRQSNENYLSNITTLRSFFTQDMRGTVDYRLMLIDCNPTEYYYENSTTFCFVCNDIDACFSYSWIYRGGGERMSASEPIYLKAEEFGIKNVNFYYDGLGTYLNCNEAPNVSDKLECNYNVSFVVEDSKVKMISAEENLEDITGVICNIFGSSEEVSCTTNEYTGIYNCRCGEVYTQIFRGTVTYGYTA